MYEIDPSVLKTVMRHCVDSNVAEALSRFRDQLPQDAEGLVGRIAQATAQNAIEQFAAYCNAQLRLIEVDHRQRVEAAALRPGSLILTPEQMAAIQTAVTTGPKS